MNIADNINFWRSYEATKDKNFIDFSKNKELESKFKNTVNKLKLEFTNDN